MSEEKKETPKEKLKFTAETIDRQMEQTRKELAYFQDQVQRSIGLLGYLQTVKEKFDLPPAEPKKPLEVQ